MTKQQQNWFVYILECNDKTLYTGITTDLDRRIEEHNSGINGAKYTLARRPVKMVYSEKQNSRSTALKREWQIKSLSRQQKQNLIDTFR